MAEPIITENGKLIIPEGVIEIDESAFENCEGIKTVEIPSSVETIGEYAFCGCAILKKVRINGPLKTIPESAFMWCKSLTEINIPPTVTTIGVDAFAGCRHLSELVIPDSVEQIGKDAFDDCDRLERIYFKHPELLEDAGVNDEAEIITDFNYEELNSKLKAGRHYVFMSPVQATAGKIIEDLEKIVALNPSSNFSVSDRNGGCAYIKGIQMWNGYVILKTSWDEKDAIKADRLLEEFKNSMLDPATGVLVKYISLLFNIKPEDGTFFYYDKDCQDNIFYVDRCDIRLFTPEYLCSAIKDLAGKHPERKLVCLDQGGKAYDVFNAFYDEAYNDSSDVISVGYNENDEHLTASEFLEACENEAYQHCVSVRFFTANRYIERSIEANEGNIFFEYKLDGEDVIAFRMGETLFDYAKDDDEDDDFFNDKDVVSIIPPVANFLI